MTRSDRYAPTPGVAVVESAVCTGVLSGVRMQATRPKHPLALALIALFRRAVRIALLCRAAKMMLVVLATVLTRAVAAIEIAYCASIWFSVSAAAMTNGLTTEKAPIAGGDRIWLTDPA